MKQQHEETPDPFLKRSQGLFQQVLLPASSTKENEDPSASTDTSRLDAVHPAPELLGDLARGWLPPSASEDLETHLLSCDECRQLYLAQLPPLASTPQHSPLASTPQHSPLASTPQHSPLASTPQHSPLASTPQSYAPASAPLQPALAPAPPAPLQEQSPSRSWLPALSLGRRTRSRSTLQEQSSSRSWLPLALAACLAGLLWGWTALWSPLSRPGTSPGVTTSPCAHWALQGSPRCTLKGGAGSWSLGRTVLHVGRVNAKGQIRRLKQGALCSPQESLVFGFSMTSPGGYPYLFRLDQRQRPELLYPFASQQASYFPAKRLGIVHQQGVPQRYNLSQEKPGPLHFVLVQTSEPLSRRQIKTLLRHRAEWDSAMRVLRRLPRFSASISFDRFTLRLSARSLAPVPKESGS